MSENFVVDNETNLQNWADINYTLPASLDDFIEKRILYRDRPRSGQNWTPNSKLEFEIGDSCHAIQGETIYFGVRVKLGANAQLRNGASSLISSYRIRDKAGSDIERTDQAHVITKAVRNAMFSKSYREQFLEAEGIYCGCEGGLGGEFGHSKKSFEWKRGKLTTGTHISAPVGMNATVNTANIDTWGATLMNTSVECTGHGLQVGDYVIIPGGAMVGADCVHQIVDVTDNNNFVITPGFRVADNNARQIWYSRGHKSTPFGDRQTKLRSAGGAGVSAGEWLYFKLDTVGLFHMGKHIPLKLLQGLQIELQLNSNGASLERLNPASGADVTYEILEAYVFYEGIHYTAPVMASLEQAHIGSGIPMLLQQWDYEDRTKSHPAEDGDTVLQRKYSMLNELLVVVRRTLHRESDLYDSLGFESGVVKEWAVEWSKIKFQNDIVMALPQQFMEYYRNMRALGNPYTDLISYTDFLEKHGVLIHDFEKIPSGGQEHHSQTGISTINQSVDVRLRLTPTPAGADADRTFTFIYGYLASVMLKKGENLVVSV